jgi:hypothetical protein
MVSIKKIVFVMLSTFILCLGMIPATITLSVKGNTVDAMVVECAFPIPTVEQICIDNEPYDRISMGNLPNSCDVDVARLPTKSLKILLPYGKTIDTVEVSYDFASSLGVGFHVEKGSKAIPIGTYEHTNDDTVNAMDDSFRSFTVIGTYVFRGYSILFLNLYPVHYLEGSGEIIWYHHMKIQVKTKPIITTNVIRDIQQDKDLLKKEVVNPEMLSTYNDAPLSTSRADNEYIIITNEALKDAAGSYTFQDLVTAKENQGITADIVTVEEIVANPDYWVNGVWGDNNPDNPFYGGALQGSIEDFNDTQAKIRNFIRYTYTEHGTQYVLLGGDADYTPSDNIVPVRKLFAVEDGLPLGSRDLIEEDIPSDVYYACLDGNFNIDGDDHWGENATQNGYNEEDEADLLSEVYVGRACADADDEVSNFVMKTLAYDASQDPYIYTALMVGEYLGFSGVSQYGGNYKDLIIPLFPEDFVVDTLYDRDGSWTKYDLMNILNTQTPHLINHLGHGNVNYGLKMYTSDIATLTNDKFFFIYSQTCLAGSFDNSGDDCAAEYFTVETAHGAFAVVMNARYGLASENTLVSPSQVLDESFFTALFTENLHALGQANHYAKEDHIWQINENGIRWVFYETNLFGDPSLKIKPHNDPPVLPPAPEGPDSGVTMREYTFTAITTDPEEEMIYYMFDWGDGTTSEWVGPYSSGVAGSAMHHWGSAGTYEIKVKAKDVNDGESPWSLSHSLVIYSTPELQIGNLTGGFFKVQATIKNIGFVNASHVTWNIALDGGALIGKETSGTLIGIPAGGERTVSSKLIIGLGSTVIHVKVSCEGSDDSKDQNATLLFFIILVKK